MDSKQLPKVLIIEDAEEILSAYEFHLSDLTKLVIATSVEEAEDALSQHNDLALVVWDYSLPDGNTLELIKATRARFPTLPMLAVSSDRLHREEQANAGCDYSVEKMDVCLSISALLYPIDAEALVN
jgi:CheY-like chemotaxis protein